MANEQNLKPIEKGQLSREEAKRRGRNGGKASGKARRERRALSDAFETLLSLPEAPGSVEELDEALSAAELDAANLSMQDRIALNVMRKAQGGDMKAVEIIRDTVGEKPADRLEVSATVSIERAADEIRALIERHREQQRRKLDVLRSLADMPQLSEAVRRGLSELYGYDAVAQGMGTSAELIEIEQSEA